MPRQAYKSFGHKTQHLDRRLWPRRKKEREQGDKETEERGSVSGNRHVARDPGAAPRTTDCHTHTHINCPGAAAIKQQMNSGSNIKWTCMSWPTVHLRLYVCVCVCDTHIHNQNGTLPAFTSCPLAACTHPFELLSSCILCRRVLNFLPVHVLLLQVDFLFTDFVAPN